MVSTILQFLLAVFLYAMLGTTVVLGLVMSGIAIWWLKHSHSPLAVFSLLLALFFLGYSVHLFQHLNVLEVLALALLVVASLQIVMESAEPKQTSP